MDMQGVVSNEKITEKRTTFDLPVQLVSDFNEFVRVNGYLQKRAAAAAKPDPLEPNDRIRAACPMLTDAQIRTVLQGYQNDLDSGITKVQQGEMSLVGCSTSSCLTCANAMIQQIYGD